MSIILLRKNVTFCALIACTLLLSNYSNKEAIAAQNDSNIDVEINFKALAKLRADSKRSKKIDQAKKIALPVLKPQIKTNKINVPKQKKIAQAQEKPVNKKSNIDTKQAIKQVESKAEDKNILGSMLGKVPFIGKSRSHNKETETVTTSEKEDELVYIKVNNIYDENHKEEFLKEKLQDSPIIANNNIKAKKLIPTPHKKPTNKQSKTEAIIANSVAKIENNTAKNKAPAEIIIAKPAPSIEKQKETTTSANDKMWQNFLKDSKNTSEKYAKLLAKDKPAPAKQEKDPTALLAKNNKHQIVTQDQKTVKNEEAVIIIAKEKIQKEEKIAPKKLKEPEPKKEISNSKPSAREVQTAPLENIAVKNKNTPPPVIKKDSNKGFFSTLKNSLPFFSSKDNEEIEQTQIRDSITIDIKPEKEEAKASPIETKASTTAKLDASLSDTNELFDRSKFISSSKRSAANNQAIIEIDNKTKHNLAKILNKGISGPNELLPIPKEEIPPVPELTIHPIKMAPAAKSKDISITLKEEKKQQPKKPIAKTDNKILISIAFDGNGVEVSDVDKTRLEEFVRKILASGQRLKILSFAHGVDGEVNSARRISLQRAIAVRMHMINAGLEKTRITVQAIGNNPGDQEFTNNVNIYAM